MESIDKDKDGIIGYLITNSIFTKKQISIIYERKKGMRVRRISRGAYYRVLQQSRNNIERLFYSIILLEILGIISKEELDIANSIAGMLKKRLNDLNDVELRDVINIINSIIERMRNV